MRLLTKLIPIFSLALILSACTKDGGFFFSHSTDSQKPTSTREPIQPPQPASMWPSPDNSPSSLSNSSNGEAQAPLSNGATNSSTNTTDNIAAPSSNVIPVGKLAPINRAAPTVKKQDNQSSSMINTD